MSFTLTVQKRGGNTKSNKAKLRNRLELSHEQRQHVRSAIQPIHFQTVPWMSVFAGLEAVAIAEILIGAFWLLAPAAKRTVEEHTRLMPISTHIVFAAGFGWSLQFAIEMQLLHGNWK